MSTHVAIRARETPITFETNGTVREARGFASITQIRSSFTATFGDLFGMMTLTLPKASFPPGPAPVVRIEADDANAAGDKPQLVVKSAVADGDRLYIDGVNFLCHANDTASVWLAGEALAGGMTVADLTWVLFNSREFVFVQ